MENRRVLSRRCRRIGAVLSVVVTLHVSAQIVSDTKEALEEYRQGDFCAAVEVMSGAIGSGASADPHVAEYEKALDARGLDHDAQRLICLLHAGVVAEDASLVVKAIASGADVDGHVDAGMTTALIEAAKGKNVDLATRLLANGASVEVADVAGWTPLHYAMAGPRQEEREQSRRRELAFLLLERKPSVNAASAVVGWTPLLLAAAAGDLALVEALLEAGAEPNEPSRVGGWTPLFLAREEGHEAVAAALRAAGGAVGSAGRDQPFPLHLWGSGSRAEWTVDERPVYAIPDFDDGYGLGGYVSHEDGSFTVVGGAERLVLERLGFSKHREDRLTATGLVHADGNVQVLWAADDYRRYMGLCRDESSGLDHAMFRESTGGSCCGPEVEFWRADPETEALSLAYSFEDTDQGGRSDSLAWPDDAGICRWQQHKAASEAVRQALSLLQVGTAVGVPYEGPFDRVLPSRAIEDGTAASSIRTLRALSEEFATVRDADTSRSTRWEVVAVAGSGRGEDDYHGTDGALLVRNRQDGGWRSIYDCGTVTVEGVQQDVLSVRVPASYDASEVDESPCSPGLGRTVQVNLSTLQVKPKQP